jgi:hypothetical protein
MRSQPIYFVYIKKIFFLYIYTQIKSKIYLKDILFCKILLTIACGLTINLEYLLHDKPLAQISIPSYFYCNKVNYSTKDTFNNNRHKLCNIPQLNIYSF